MTDRTDRRPSPAPSSTAGPAGATKTPGTDASPSSERASLPGPFHRPPGITHNVISAFPQARSHFFDRNSGAARVPWREAGQTSVDERLTHEWLVTNGLGGYASGTVAGACTRRYHGTLISALPAPFGRTLMLGHIQERVILPDGTIVQLSSDDLASGEIEMPMGLREFKLEVGLPVWVYEADGVVIEKRLFMVHRQNTVHVRYRLLEGQGAVQLRVRPSFNPRGHDAKVSHPVTERRVLTAEQGRYELSFSADLPSVRMILDGTNAAFLAHGGELRDLLYRIERARGYDCVGPVWTPGELQVTLERHQTATLVASTESWEVVLALAPDEAATAELHRRTTLVQRAHPAARSGFGAEMVLAADQFVINPKTRTADAARAYARGDAPRTVIAGYHWFTDWGRDTMISLEGLTLVTGRHAEAGYILRTFAQYAREGLIPNLFPEGQHEGLYHTADATLWFFHAVSRYVKATGDVATLQLLLPTLRDIVTYHQRGTRFGIGVDPTDGLLRQGAEGYQLTWMDAKVDDWVVTPRRGKAVEINALWYNALKLLASWIRTEQPTSATEADQLDAQAERAKESFQRRFWYEAGGHLYDVIDGEHGDDPACRPNQVIAISLDNPILDPTRWRPVMEVVRDRLLTPVGLRSLSREHTDYKPTYDGDLRSRDAAYHQGTVWAWLVGPYVDAWRKVFPGDEGGVRRALEGFIPHLGQACVGSISEIFDAEPPYTPRGCVAQAWSVAEVLRAWVTLSGHT